MVDNSALSTRIRAGIRAGGAVYAAAVLQRVAGGMSVAVALAAENRAVRNRLISRLWREVYPNLPRTQASSQIAGDLARYVASAWRFDRRATACPHASGTPKALMWQVLATGERVPKSRQVFEIMTSVSPSDCIE
jgi:hypothetical protein